MLRVLYDGWSLVYAPNSPAALHLLALLAALPAGIDAEVALPGLAPDWLPPGVGYHIEQFPDTPRAHLVWEQKTLPQIANQSKAGLLHLVTITPSLFGRLPTAITPAGFAANANSGTRRGFYDRLHESVTGGAVGRDIALLWPEDLPVNESSQDQFIGRGASILRLPPLFYLGLEPTGLNLPPLEELALPDVFVLYHGPDNPKAIRRLLDVWSWPAGSFGESYPLLLLGMGDTARLGLPSLLVEYGLEEQVRLLPVLSPGAVAQLYRSCTALLHPAPISPWGDPVRSALACGKPVVAADSPLADALVGPAAYLLPDGDARSFGAALITTIVEETVAERLSKAARERAAGWDTGAFGARLLEAYQRII